MLHMYSTKQRVVVRKQDVFLHIQVNCYYKLWHIISVSADNALSGNCFEKKTRLS